MASKSRFANLLPSGQKHLSFLIMASLLVILILSTMSFNAKVAIAQVPPIPSPPTEDDTNDQLEQQPTPSTATNASSPTIEITSHKDGDQVPVGELKIEGISSDDKQSNCQVYADVNDIAPLQNATAAGPGGQDDFSKWTFTYTKDYQLITEGTNELTTKISCFGVNDVATPMSEWYSVNITGVASATSPAANTTTEEPASAE